MRNRISALVICALLPAAAFGWGQKGHDITACIAERHLTPAAKEAVDSLFYGKSLVYWGAWLDSASNQDEWRYTKTWHYKNVDAGETLETARIEPAGDALTAIRSQCAVLMSPSSTFEERQFALKVIDHVAGDLHQPMHMGHASDRGGNSIMIKYFGKESKLHSVWDSSLIESAHKWSYSEWADQIDRAPQKYVDEVLAGSLDDWARESVRVAAYVYDYFTPGSEASYDAVFHWTMPIEDLLLRGGLRLASILNYVFDPDWRAAHPGIL